MQATIAAEQGPAFASVVPGAFLAAASANGIRGLVVFVEVVV
jgi:hypothetical protein